MKKLRKTSIVDDDRIYIFGLSKLIEMNDFCQEIQVFNNGKEAFLDKAKTYDDIVDYVVKPIKSSDLQKISKDYF